MRCRVQHQIIIHSIGCAGQVILNIVHLHHTTDDFEDEIQLSTVPFVLPEQYGLFSFCAMSSWDVRHAAQAELQHATFSTCFHGRNAVQTLDPRLHKQSVRPLKLSWWELLTLCKCISAQSGVQQQCCLLFSCICLYFILSIKIVRKIVCLHTRGLQHVMPFRLPVRLPYRARR